MYINNDVNWISFLNNKQVYIFGCGKIGKYTLNSLAHNRIDVAGYIDNNKEKIGNSFMGLDVYSIENLREELLENNQRNFIVIASEAYKSDIELQLLNEGICNFITYDQIDFSGGVSIMMRHILNGKKRLESLELR